MASLTRLERRVFDAVAAGIAKRREVELVLAEDSHDVRGALARLREYNRVGFTAGRGWFVQPEEGWTR